MSDYTIKLPSRDPSSHQIGAGLRRGGATEAGDTSAIPLELKDDWEQGLRKAAASQHEESGEDLDQRHERADLQDLAEGLRRQIEQMRHHHAGLSHVASEVEGHQLRQINSLMTMIASLSRTLDPGHKIPDYQQISGLMRSLEDKLSLQRQQQTSDRSSAQNALSHMHGERAALERELAAINQQLAALHARLSSLGAM